MKKEQPKEASTCGLSLDLFTERWVSRESDPDDEWSSDSHEESNSIQEVSLCMAGEHSDIVGMFAAKEGDEVHVLSARYGTGDSFHSDSGLFFPVAAFKTARLAEFAKAAILAASEYPMISFFEEDGSLKKMSAPWNGYFEVLESVDVKSFIVKKPRR